MTQPNSKIAAYIAQRVLGIDPHQSARLAGYSEAGLSVAASRNETREDVRTAIRKAKRDGVAVKGVSVKPGRPRKPVPPRGQADDDSDDVPEQLQPWKLRDHYDSPLDLLRDVMNNPKAPGGLRIQCAKDAMPYCHARKEGGKKDDEKSKAKDTAAGSKFGTQSKPSHLARVA